MLKEFKVLLKLYTILIINLNELFLIDNDTLLYLINTHVHV